MVNPSDYELGREPVEVEVAAQVGLIVSLRPSAEEADHLMPAAEDRGLMLAQLLCKRVPRKSNERQR
ncbi:MAG: hypothetical protein ACR2PL_08235 [Dehalococcoidia bacterium]